MSRQISRKSLVNIIVRLLTPILGLVTLIFVKRYLGYAGLGMLAFSFSFVKMFSILSDLGFSTAHLKKANEDLDKGICNGTIISIKLFLTIVMGVVVVLYIQVTKYINSGKLFESDLLEILVYLALLRLLLDNVYSIFGILAAANLQAGLGVIPFIISRVLRMLLKIGLVIFGFGVFHIASVEVFSSLALVLIFLYYLRRYPIKRPTWEYVKIYSKFAIPVAFIGFASVYLRHIDKIMVGSFLDTESVGVLVLAQSITEIFLIFSTATNPFLFSTFSKLYTQERKEKISYYCNSAAKYSSIFVIPPLAFIFVFADSLLVLGFGDDAVASAPIIRILICAQYINIIRTPYALQILSTGHLYSASFLTMSLILTNTLLNLFFIPNEIFGIKMMGLGVKGAAFTTLASFIVNLFLVLYFVNQISGSKIYSNLWKHIFSLLFATSFLYFLGQYGIDWYHLLFYPFLTIFLFWLPMYILGEIREKEIRFIIDTINPKKLWNYIIDEERGTKINNE